MIREAVVEEPLRDQISPEERRRRNQLKRMREVRRVKRRLKMAFLVVILFLTFGFLALGRNGWMTEKESGAFFEGENRWKVSKQNAPDMAYDLGNRAVYLETIASLADRDERYQMILERQEEYPEGLLRICANHEETLDFVLQYPEKKNSKAEKTVGKTEKGEIPLLIQWDEDWGYAPYGEETIVGVSGCGPTCIAMVACGLTGKNEITPAVVAEYSAQNGFLTETRDTSWDLLTVGAKEFGIVGTELGLDEEAMIRELSLGHPIIASVGPGDFTSGGHLLVIREYRDGLFGINDPNSRVRSERMWTFEELSGQIVNMWSYTTTDGAGL
jgi:hypothetical protein